jgi:26S proteasome regulatory subunit N2
MPTIDYLSNAPPSIFAYPLALVDKKEEKKDKIETAKLSITAITKKRDLKKKHEESTPMEIVNYLFKTTFFFFILYS